MKRAVPVTITTAIQKTVPVQIQEIGNVQAYSTVSVRSQVSGQLIGVYFQRGQRVTKGQLLFTVDPRPLQASLREAQGNLSRDLAQVNQAQANLARDIAQAQNAQAQFRRYSSLASQGAVSQEQFAQYSTSARANNATVAADRAAVQNALATVRADRAALQNANVQLSYTSIYSPIEGITGNLLVDRGNLVQANSTNSLVIITQIRPIQVSFSVPQEELPEIRRYLASRKLPLAAIILNDHQPPVPGVLNFVNNTVDVTTGTIQMLGDFANTQERLWPGQFVNVVMQLTTEPNAIVVPSPAVQTGQNDKYVFVVKPDLTVESRTVLVDRIVDGQAVIAQGLQPGEKVVTDGQFNLVPGAKVAIKNTVNMAGGNAS
jgi:multidrug efflux system membrane fusion protein